MHSLWAAIATYVGASGVRGNSAAIAITATSVHHVHSCIHTRYNSQAINTILHTASWETLTFDLITDNIMSITPVFSNLGMAS